MRVLQVMSSCGYRAGVAQVVMRYYRNIHREIDFDFLLYWDVEGSYKEEIQAYGGKLFFTGRPGLRQMPAYIRWVDRFFAEHGKEYDAVQLHEIYLNSIILRAAKKYGVPVRIAHSHTTKLSDSRLRAVRNAFLYLPVKRYANVFFACSADAGKAAFGRGILKDERFHVIRNAIALEEYRFSPENRKRIREEMGLKEETLVIGHVGRFAPSKNHCFLLELFCELLKQKTEAKLVLVGVGEDMQKVQQRCEELGLSDSVLFTGLRKDVPAVLSAFDLFCLPSRFEGLGLVLVEAQANGLACLASDGVPEEARVLPSYRRLALRAGAGRWAEELLQMDTQREADTDGALAASGFDIVPESEKLMGLFSELKKTMG